VIGEVLSLVLRQLFVISEVPKNSPAKSAKASPPHYNVSAAVVALNSNSAAVLTPPRARMYFLMRNNLAAAMELEAMNAAILSHRGCESHAHYLSVIAEADAYRFDFVLIKKRAEWSWFLSVSQTIDDLYSDMIRKQMFLVQR
jgi:hypothetical protein